MGGSGRCFVVGRRVSEGSEGMWGRDVLVSFCSSALPL